MALDTAFYLVTVDIAKRSGLIDNRYRTLDDRYILDNKDLSRVRFTTDEYISGLKGVEKITEDAAMTLIAQGGYKKGLPSSNMSVTQPEERAESGEETPVYETSEQEEDESNDTNEKEKEE